MSFKRCLTICSSNVILSSIVYKTTISCSFMMVSKAELKSVPVIYIFYFAFSALAIIYLYAHAISPVLLFWRYALCERERYSSTFGFSLANKTFDNIFLMIGSKITGLKFITTPFVLSGFCSGAESLMPVSLYANIITYAVIQYTCKFVMEFFRTILNHFSYYLIIPWYSIVIEIHNTLSNFIKCHFMF